MRYGRFDDTARECVIDRVASAFGEACCEVPVGLKHISAAMERHGAIIGGQSSGGLAVKNWNGIREVKRMHCVVLGERRADDPDGAAVRSSGA